jgi:hypothetical protein
MGRGRSRAADGSRPATIDDIHEIVRSLPGVTLGGARGRLDPTVNQVSRRSFLFFRNPRPDAVDPDTGQRYTDVSVAFSTVDPFRFRAPAGGIHVTPAVTESGHQWELERLQQSGYVDPVTVTGDEWERQRRQ